MEFISVNEGIKLKRIGRKKKLYINNRVYFKWNGRRYHLNNIMRMEYPIMFYRDDHTLDYCSGYMTISNTYGILVCIAESGEYVEIFEEREE